MYGKGRLYFKLEGDSGHLDLGNVPSFSIEPKETKEDHFSSRSGLRVKDMTLSIETNVTSKFTLEEFSKENVNIAFKGGDIQDGAQSKGYLSGQTLTTVADRYVSVGKTDVSWLKVRHGTVANGPFEPGDTITAGSVTALVVQVGSGFLGCINASGAIPSGATITSGTTTATVTGTENVPGVLLANHATVGSITTVYDDSDYSFDAVEGLIRELSGGSIASHTAYVYADYKATTTFGIRAMSSTSKIGNLLFVGDPAVGPRWRVEGWRVELTLSGAVDFISEKNGTMEIEAEFLADTANHPENPFFYAELKEY
jgi:hypothetical protein